MGNGGNRASELNKMRFGTSNIVVGTRGTTSVKSQMVRDVSGSSGFRYSKGKKKRKEAGFMLKGKPSGIQKLIMS